MSHAEATICMYQTDQQTANYFQTQLYFYNSHHILFKYLIVFFNIPKETEAHGVYLSFTFCCLGNT